MKIRKPSKFIVRNELVKLECLDCGANLEIQSETRAYCKFCGQTYFINELLERIPDIPSEMPQEPVKPQTPPPQIQRSQSKNTFGTLGLVMMIVGICSFVFLLFCKEANKLSETAESTPNGILVENTQETNDSTEKWDGFRSETMKQVVYLMFGKPADEVTKEELESIKYFKLENSWETCTFSYSVEDYRDYEPDYLENLPDYNGSILFGYNKAFEETIQKFSLPYPQEDFALIYGDIRNFTNLTSISLRDYSDIDFSDMPHLTMIDCGWNLDDLLNTNLCFDQIEVLMVSDCDLAGLEKFTSLKKLFIEGIDADNMEYVVKCTTLDTLFCNYCFEPASYEPLKQLTGLKSLYIDGGYNAIKDLSMISSFTELENLSITCTDILNIGFVKDLKNLRTLRLSENSKLDNFDGIGSLQELEYLELNINGLNGSQPQYAEIGNLKNLKSLSLHTVYNLDFLYELEQLEKLEIRLTFYDDFMLPIAKMKNLRDLTLSQINEWTLPDGHFALLQELPQLKKLTIDKVQFEKPVDELFTVEGLEELRITNSGFEIVPTQIIVRDNLKVLDLSGTYFGDYYNGNPNDEQEVLNQYCKATSIEKLNLSYFDVTDLSVLNKLTNLKELSLCNCELTNIPETTFEGCTQLEKLDLSYNQTSDIRFVKNLPHLKFFEIREGYVTDLSPLMDCPLLRYVDVRQNPIAENPLTDAVVITE